jgi:hypothetical protein
MSSPPTMRLWHASLVKIRAHCFRNLGWSGVAHTSALPNVFSRAAPSSLMACPRCRRTTGYEALGMALTFAVIAVTALVLVAQGFNYLAASLTSEARRRGGLRRGPRISVVLPTTGGRNSACGRMCLPTPPACGGVTVSSKLSAPGLLSYMNRQHKQAHIRTNNISLGSLASFERRQ